MSQTIDYSKASRVMIDSMKEYFKKCNLHAAVLGISGGIDSTLVAVLMHKVSQELNSENYAFTFYGVSLPTPTTPENEFWASQMVGHAFCDSFYVDKEMDEVSQLTKDWVSTWKQQKIEPLRYGNIKARLRMMYLYNKARENKGFVVGTDNYTEMLLGFSTIGGDALADYMPLQYLWKTDVYGIARYLVTKYKDAQDWNKVAAVTASIEIPPQDGLGISNSDMDQIGAKNYFDVDHILYVYENFMAEMIYDFSDFIKSEEYNVLTQMYGDAVSNVIMRRRKNFKLNLPIIYKRGWQN